VIFPKYFVIIIIIIIITENNKNLSASSLQVGVVRACAATLPNPELVVLL